MSNISFEPTVKTEGATKMYQDAGDIIKNSSMHFIVLDQNDEDTLLQKVKVDDEGKIIEKLNYFVVAWGLQSDGSWNQGHYFGGDAAGAKKAFKDRALERVKTESDDSEPGTDRADRISAFSSFIKKASQNETAKNMKSIAEKYGYKLYTPYIASWGETQIKLVPSDDYYPDVYWYEDEGKITGTFKINNASYGSMDLDKYAEVLKHCQDAYAMCKELSEVDLSKLDREIK